MTSLQQVSKNHLEVQHSSNKDNNIIGHLKIQSLANEEETQLYKMNLQLFNLHYHYSSSLTLSNVGKIPKERESFVLASLH